jgi:integrase
MKIEIKPGQFVAVINRMNVSQAFEKWESWAASVYESANSSTAFAIYVRAWIRDTKVASTPVDQIGERDLDRWVNKTDGCKATTRRFRLAALRSFFFYCKEKMYRMDDPSMLVSVRYKDLDHEQKEPRVKRVFTDDEYNRLVAYLKANQQYINYPFWLSATMIARHSALRMGDICCLQWPSITDRLVVHTDKRNRRVDIPVTPQLREAFDTIPKGTKKWCFPKQAIISSDTKRRSGLSNQFSRILKEAGIEGHHFHELRHASLSAFVRDGNSIEAARDMAGHSSTEQTRHYVHYAEVSEVADKARPN